MNHEQDNPSEYAEVFLANRKRGEAGEPKSEDAEEANGHSR